MRPPGGCTRRAAWTTSTSFSKRPTRRCAPARSRSRSRPTAAWRARPSRSPTRRAGRSCARKAIVWSAAGEGSSPRRADYPRYVETGTEETPRGYHALRVLTGKSDWTGGELTAAAFDSYLPAFERMIPPLVAAYDQTPATDTLKAKLAEPIAALRGWDYRWGA